jgi:hypothetical protein
MQVDKALTAGIRVSERPHRPVDRVKPEVRQYR